MIRVRPSRIVAVAMIAAFIFSLTQCGNIAYGIINAPSYIGSYDRHADLRFGDQPRQALDVYVPQSRDKELRPVVIFWYGGMWLRGSKEQYRFVGAALANSGYVAILPDYRLYPRARFPVFVEDGALAVKWAREHAQEFGGDPNAIFLMGHSAGAHTAALLALDGRYLQKVGGDQTWLRGWIGMSGPYALELRVPILEQMFRSPYLKSDWRVVDLVRGPAPPALILHGTDDYLVYPREAIDLDTLLRAAGARSECHIYDGASHLDVVAAFSLPFRYEAPSLADVARFIDRTVAADSSVPTQGQGGTPCPALVPRKDHSVPGGVRVELTNTNESPLRAAHPDG
jgi:acetyl esterase/lipase